MRARGDVDDGGDRRRGGGGARAGRRRGAGVGLARGCVELVCLRQPPTHVYKGGSTKPTRSQS